MFLISSWYSLNCKLYLNPSNIWCQFTSLVISLLTFPHTKIHNISYNRHQTKPFIICVFLLIVYTNSNVSIPYLTHYCCCYTIYHPSILANVEFRPACVLSNSKVFTYPVSTTCRQFVLLISRMNILRKKNPPWHSPASGCHFQTAHFHRFTFNTPKLNGTVISPNKCHKNKTKNNPKFTNHLGTFSRSLRFSHPLSRPKRHFRKHHLKRDVSVEACVCFETVTFTQLTSTAPHSILPIALFSLIQSTWRFVRV